MNDHRIPVVKQGEQSKQRGFTLAEILVGMVLGMFLITGIIQLFTGNKQAYTMNDAVSRIQENGRFAIETLTSSVRMASFAGCVPLCPVNITTSACTASTTGTCHCLENTLNNSTVWWENFAINSLQGYDGTQELPVTGTKGLFVASGGDRIAGTDAIIAIGSDGGYAVDTAIAPTTSQINILQLSRFNGGSLGVGDILLTCNSTNTSLFQVSQVATTTSTHTTSAISHSDTTTIAPGNSTTTLAIAYPTVGTFVLDYIPTAYYIGTSSSGVGHSLYQLQLQFGSPNCSASTACMVSQELIDGVEDMQIFYGVAASNGIISQYKRAAAVTASEWAYASDNRSGVVAARIYLLLSSGSTQNLFPDDKNGNPQHQTYVFPMDTDDPNLVARLITASDQRAYQVFSTTIGIRNRLP